MQVAFDEVTTAEDWAAVKEVLAMGVPIFLTCHCAQIRAAALSSSSMPRMLSEPLLVRVENKLVFFYEELH